MKRTWGTAAGTATIVKMTTCAALGFIQAGCAAGWYKAGVSEDRVAQARANCEELARSQVPPYMAQVVTRPGYKTPVRTTCDQQGSRSTCVTSGGDYMPPEVEIQDINADHRNTVLTDCMIKQGYKFKLW